LSQPAVRLGGVATVDPSADQSVDQGADQSADQGADQSADESADRLAMTVPDAPGRLPAFSVVDIETSGLSTRRHRILQLAVARVEFDAQTGVGAIVDEWSSLVKLRWPWQRVGPRRVHGISRDRLRGAPATTDVLAEFARRTGRTVLVAHNMGFDWTFIERAARRHGVALDTNPRLCTLRLSRRLDPDRTRSHRLADLCERYEIVNEHPHDAAFDARCTALVLPHLLRAHGIASADDLVGFYER
jgi:DNA polymerase-3 subunit epsilon